MEDINPTRSVAERAATDDTVVYKTHRNELIAQVINTAIRYGSFVILGWFFVLVIRALAGHSTFADIGIKLLANIQFSAKLAWAVGICGAAYGGWERRLRHRVNETLGTRVSELEAQLDPGRSSSALTPRGQTNPRDRR